MLKFYIVENCNWSSSFFYIGKQNVCYRGLKIRWHFASNYFWSSVVELQRNLHIKYIHYFTLWFSSYDTNMYIYVNHTNIRNIHNLTQSTLHSIVCHLNMWPFLKNVKTLSYIFIAVRNIGRPKSFFRFIRKQWMHDIFLFILFYRITYDPFCSIKIRITTFDRLGFMFV